MKFRKKPVEIEARLLSTTINESKVSDLARWCGGSKVLQLSGQWAVIITTLEGQMLAQPGDWIIKGVQGEFYPCKPNIFEETYDPID